MDDNKRQPVSRQEQEQVARALLDWLSQYDALPCPIEFEYLPKDAAGMALTVVQSTKTEEYITGDYNVSYQFGIWYRSQSGDSDDRLNAVALLDGLADWAERQEVPPDLGPQRTVSHFATNAAAALAAAYNDGSEDYQVLMTMDYEVRL